MNSRPFHSRTMLTAVFLFAVAVAFIAPAVVAGQQHSSAAGSDKAPRAADGQPDLQGYWTILTYTPFERPPELAGKPLYTEQEALDAFNKAVAAMDDQIVHYAHTDFMDTPVQTGARPNRRTSLVVDPPDGKLPPLTPEAQERVAARQAEERARGPLPATVSEIGAFNGCVFNAAVGPFIPGIYNSNYHIVQTPGWLLVIYEWNSEHRVIPLDGRPHLPDSIRTYAGDSRGRWEGDTLVVETTNFSPKRNFRGSEGTFKLTEWFTRTAADTIEYKFAVEDPTTWTKPWTAIVPMYRIKGPMLEYACNENNQDAYATLKNARAQEKGIIGSPSQTRRGDPKAVVREREDEALRLGEPLDDK